jgi:hypothetical protein
MNVPDSVAACLNVTRFDAGDGVDIASLTPTALPDGDELVRGGDGRDGEKRRVRGTALRGAAGTSTRVVDAARHHVATDRRQRRRVILLADEVFRIVCAAAAAIRRHLRVRAQRSRPHDLAMLDA